MRRISIIVILIASPLLLAALWMDHQPSWKPYQSPVLVPPATAVPFSAIEIVSPQAELKNPAIPSESSLSNGKKFFDINCALCHGQTPGKPGPVGAKLKPPPPGLDPELVKGRSDSHIFNAITNGFGRMPSFKGKISPLERWDLINFLRTRH
jgi:mono/diheme cytochrome c family protein